MRFLILLIPILALAGEPALPRELETLKASYDRDLEKLKADHDAAVLKRTDAYRMKLLDVQTTLTKGGDLDGALAAKRFRESLPMFAVPEKSSLPSLTAAQADTVLAHVEDLTQADWEGLPGQVVAVDASKRTKTGIQVRPTDRFLVVAAPRDQWGGGGSQGMKTCSWKGYQGTGHGWMSMSATVGGSSCALGAVTGTGELVLFATDEKPEDNNGAVRVKVLVIK